MQSQDNLRILWLVANAGRYSNHRWARITSYQKRNGFSNHENRCARFAILSFEAQRNFGNRARGFRYQG